MCTRWVYQCVFTVGRRREHTNDIQKKNAGENAIRQLTITFNLIELHTKSRSKTEGQRDRGTSKQRDRQADSSKETQHKTSEIRLYIFHYFVHVPCSSSFSISRFLPQFLMKYSGCASLKFARIIYYLQRKWNRSSVKWISLECDLRSHIHNRLLARALKRQLRR